MWIWFVYKVEDEDMKFREDVKNQNCPIGSDVWMGLGGNCPNVQCYDSVSSIPGRHAEIEM